MAVTSHREILPRGFSHKYGSAPEATVKYSATLDGPTDHQEILNAINILHGDPHPEFSYLYCTEGKISEVDYYHAEVEYTYELPPVEQLQIPAAGGGGGGGGGGGSVTFDPHPLAMMDEISYSTSTRDEFCYTYYKKDGTQGPLVNTAGDLIDNVSRVVAELKFSIKGNRAQFPHLDALAVTGAVNSNPWNGGAAHTWLCSGISGDLRVDLVNAGLVAYWNIGVELSYRPEGWDREIMNIGYRVVKNGKLVTPVLSSEHHESDVTYATKPVALNPDGTHKQGAPDKMMVQVQRAIDFDAFFGTPTVRASTATHFRSTATPGKGTP